VDRRALGELLSKFVDFFYSCRRVASLPLLTLAETQKYRSGGHRTSHTATAVPLSGQQQLGPGGISSGQTGESQVEKSQDARLGNFGAGLAANIALVLPAQGAVEPADGFGRHHASCGL
jgi:hypothetical protein